MSVCRVFLSDLRQASHLPGKFHVLEIRRNDVPKRPERVDGVPQLRRERDRALRCEHLILLAPFVVEYLLCFMTGSLKLGVPGVARAQSASIGRIVPASRWYRR